LLVAAAPTLADQDARYAAVSALGELNGVALNCRYVDQVRRMKAAVVDNVPKERSFGLAFDEATNRAFLAFIRAARECPGPAEMERQVDQGIQNLHSTFANP
jgi:hypothetical protein